MASKQETSASPARSQPSGVLEQEEAHATIPLDLHTPNKAEARHPSPGALTKGPSPATVVLAEPNGYQTLADRIKSRSRRSTSHSSSQVPSPAVHALAETVDAAIAPDTGAAERYLDSRDTDHNVPEGIPGVSEEQAQHRQQPAQQPQSAEPAAKASAVADMQQGAATPAQAKPTRPRKGSKAALLQTAAQLAQNPDVSEDVLQENDKVRASNQLQVHKQGLIMFTNTICNSQ